MTDGDDTSDVASEQRLASENDIIIYAIRIAANATDENELVNAVGDASRVFTAVNFVGLSNAIEAICKDIGFSSSSVSTPQLPLAKSCGCDDVKQLSKLRYWLDMIFIVDTSDAISTEDFASIKNVLLTMTRTNVNTMMNETNGQYSRMGIINFGKTAEVFTELNNTFPECEYRNFIRQKFSSIGGSSTGIRDALVLAHDMFGNEENAGNRLGFKKVVVLFTTAGIKCYHLVDGRQKLIASEFCELVSAMKNNGVTFITVALKE
uniref:VWFA domain-containing protein n=1 Tax=Syphacia muris TaxID=451379 RepID=A0A0N5ACS4_9BILA